MTPSIKIQQHLIEDCKALVQVLSPLASRFALITDAHVASLFGKQFVNGLHAEGLKIELFAIPAGEEHKTRKTKEELEDSLLNKGYGKDSGIIALGGGTVSDIAGYLAATYCRGIPLVLIPTTLLAMVDASIGGKNGVNVLQGKNMIGTIYPPKHIWIDPTFLNTLPEKEIKNGFVEMIKHGIVSDPAYFTFIESHTEELLAGDSLLMEKAIHGSCCIKTTLVAEDEKDNGKRRLLNFGHTIGHAIESLTHYQVSHGEAVAIGIVVESTIAMTLGHLSETSLNRIKKLFKQLSISTCYPSSLSFDALIAAMALDKKAVNGIPRFILINEIGSPLPDHYCSCVDHSLIKYALSK